MAKQKAIEHKPKCCPLCGKLFMNLHGQPLPNHTQIKCVTTDGNEMEIGVCRDCYDKGVSMDTVNGILEGIKLFWTEEVDNDKTLKVKEKKQRKDFHNGHTIGEVRGVRFTGKEAQKKAKKMGKLK